MTFHRWSFLRCGVAGASLVVLAGWAAAAGASAAGLPPGSIHSGTSLSDSRIARDSELKASDFPRGWFSTPESQSLGHSPCPGVNAAEAAVSGHAISPSFTGMDPHTAGSTTYVYTNSGEATHSFRELTSRRTRDCVVRTISQNTAQGTGGQNLTIGPFRVHRLAVPPIGDQTSGYRLSVRVSSGGIGLNVTTDLVFMRVGRGDVVFAFGGVESPFNRGLESKLMHDVASRLARDFAGGS